MVYFLKNEVENTLKSKIKIKRIFCEALITGEFIENIEEIERFFDNIAQDFKNDNKSS